MSEDIQEPSENAPSPDEIVESSPTPEAATEEVKAEVPQESEPKKVNKVQERINQLTREKYEERQRAAELEQRLKDLEAKASQPKQPELSAPKEDDFDDYSQYQQAQAQYVSEAAAEAAYKRLSAENQERERRNGELQRQEELSKKKAKFDSNLETKKANFEDFENVAYGHQFMSIEMAERLMDMDKGPEVAYHLGSHLDQAERIFSLSPIDQAIELTKLEYQVEALVPKKVSSAPDPIKPIGNSEVVNKSEDDMSDDEWLTWRNNQINQKMGLS